MIERMLAEAGASMADIVRVTYYLVDRAEAARLSPVFGEILGGVRPPASPVILSGLPEEAMRIEIKVPALTQVPNGGYIFDDAEHVMNLLNYSDRLRMALFRPRRRPTSQRCFQRCLAARQCG